jgi:hypothetical protein
MRFPAVIAVGLAVAALGCGLGACGGEDSSIETYQAPWKLNGLHPSGVPLSPATRDIPIYSEVDTCIGPPWPRIERASVREESARILVTAYVHEEPIKAKRCLGIATAARGTIHLDHPLGSRSIYDTAGETRPGFERPILRWPGQSVWPCLRRLPAFSRLPELNGRPRVTAPMVYAFQSAILGAPDVLQACAV